MKKPGLCVMFALCAMSVFIVETKLKLKNHDLIIRKFHEFYKPKML